jgi:ABC-type multidrug transport system fused ATPase/permease subunit
MRTGLRELYLKRLLGHALRYKWLLGLTETAGALNVALTFVFPWLIGSAIDRVTAPDWTRWGMTDPPSFEQRSHALWKLVGIGAGTALMFGVITYTRGHYTVKLGNRIIADLRRDLFDHLQRLSLHFYSKERTGSIVSRLINDIQQAGDLVNGGVVLVVMDLVQTLVALVFLFSISWKLALACIGILPLYVLTFKVFNERVRAASDRVQSQLGKISGTVQERLAGIALVKANDGEQRERERFHHETEEHFGRIVEQSSLAHFVGAISETLVHSGTVIVVGYGSYLALTRDGGMSTGALIAFLGYLGIMYGPVRRFADLNIVYQTSMVALDRVFRVLDITPKIVEKRRAVGRAPERGEVRFEHVRFCYQDDSDESRVSLEDDASPLDDATLTAPTAAGEPPARPNTEDAPANGSHNGNGACHTLPDGRRWVLDDLDFTAAAGERVALVGPSGSGKSTIVSLLPRLYDVSDGRILIDGVDVRDYRLSALRQSIAIVQQESMVFSGSVRDNLKYGRPHARDEEVVEAAKAANAHEFIAALPGGYDTQLGERGVNLSGGQRQRLSIARALLKDPRILILDEATSALDTESEALVQAALERLMHGRTCFIIAHRLSTVRGADRILVIQNGRVAEEGPHEALLARNGLYARLVQHQFGRRRQEVEQELVGAGA